MRLLIILAHRVWLKIALADVRVRIFLGLACIRLSTRLARFAVPRFIAFVDTLPTTENGKVQKYKLRERGITPQAWDREAAGKPSP